MWQNILTIIVIILLSAFFRQKTNNSFNSQMLFILLSLVALVFYKLMYLNNIKKNKDILIVQNKEGFDNTIDSKINNFVHNTTTNEQQNEANHNQSQKTIELHNRIDNLENIINDFKNSTSKHITDKTAPGIDTDIMIQEQLNDIKNMEKDIIDIYKESANATPDNKYPSIQLYSSCVSNADGTITNNDNDNNNNTKQDNIITPDINIHL